MLQIRVSAILATLFTIALVFLLETRLGVLPPMGRFFDPIGGVWQLTRVDDLPQREKIRLAGLREEVTVYFNERGVPHIFALNEPDLYRTAGYLTARHRLWQMDITARAFAGQLSEILGPAALPMDFMQRQLGASDLTRTLVGNLAEHPEIHALVNAYSEGVNAWISTLPRREIPFEYRLLGIHPQPWSPERSVHVMLSMAQILTQTNFSPAQTALKEAFGVDVPETFFPDFPPSIEPAFPLSGEVGSSGVSRNAPRIKAPSDRLGELPPDFPGQPGVGSNNWAIAGSRSASGSPLLASDPHLSLGLPSIWYEAQYHTPDQNVYGLALAGNPVPVIGFNAWSAWGSTDLSANASDFYAMELDETGTRYRFEGEWHPLRKEEETIPVRGREPQSVTVVYSRKGPIPAMPGASYHSPQLPAVHAFRWTSQEPGNPLVFFWEMGFNRTVEGFRAAAAQLAAPGLATVFANQEGDIALQANGAYPLRRDRAPRYIRDGTRADPEWSGRIAPAEMPFVVNPPGGFVSSANQHPVTEDFPYRFGWYFGSRARPHIINRTLEQSEGWTLADMKALQLNEQNYWAEEWLDLMLEILETSPRAAEQGPELNWRLGVRILRDWNRVNAADSLAATLFDAWLVEIRRSLWAPMIQGIDRPLQTWPDWQITLKTLFNGYGQEAYLQMAGALPNPADLTGEAFSRALEGLEASSGPMGERWAWWRHNGAILNHTLGIPALGTGRLRVGGHAESPNAISGNHGPSWRMVVELSDPVRAYGIAPGGQPSNPASPGSRATIPKWIEGGYHELMLYPDAEAAARNLSHSITFTP